MRNQYEVEAARLTKEFLTYARRVWGTPVQHTRQSAMFEKKYANGRAIDGWHGGGRYGVLNCVMDIWDGSKYPVKCLISWEHIYKTEPRGFNSEDLGAYKEFLLQARKLLT